MKNFQEYKNPICIWEGAQGKVYRISKNHVAKVLFSNLHLDNLVYESQIANELFDNEVSVPKPEGIFPLKISNNLKICFVMEFVDGKTGFELNKTEWTHVRENLLEKEIGKVKSLGFHPYDAYCMGNSIWSPKKDKLYLIDFAMWSKK